jgi:CoA:oxalate CoA-transferase
MGLPLEGVRVIDFGQVYAAPYCTLQLAAMGAEIIKIEPPGTGELLRALDAPPGSVSYFFLMLNANKKSVTVNLKHPRGREIALRLLEDADVLVENFTAGVMESWGLGYEQLAPRFPRLVYASGKGFGTGSRWAKLASMDNTIQAASGLISVTGFPEHGVKTSATFIDMSTGSHLTSGILAALFERERTGRGQKVEVAMMDVCVPAMTGAIATALQGRKFKRLGNRHWGVCPSNVYPAADGEVLIFCMSEAHWRALARLMGREDLLAMPQYKTHATRLRIADQVDALVGQWTGAHRRDDVVGLMLKSRIPCAPVRDVDEVARDPEVALRRMLVDSEFPTRGPIKVTGSPVKLSALAPDEMPNGRPPKLGEHTEEVLASIGISREEIQLLRGEGAV